MAGSALQGRGAAMTMAPMAPAVMLGAASSRIAERLAAAAMAARRWGPRPVPVEPGPVWAANPIAAAPSQAAVTASGAGADNHGCAAPERHPSAPASALSVSPVTAAAIAIAARVVAPSGAGRSARARSVKNGPPKAPRRRIVDARRPATGAALPAAGAIAVDEADCLAATAPRVDPTLATPIRVEAGEAGAVPASTARKPQMIAVVQSPAVERVRSTRAQQIGDDGERLAAIRLEALGWRIIARNLRVCRAEVDILAIDPSDPPSLVLVEVRRRNRRDFGLAEETVDFRKRNAMRRAAGELAMRPVLPDGRRVPDLPVRVDLIAIDAGPDGRPSLRHHRGIDV